MVPKSPNKHLLRKSLIPIEIAFLSDYYFSLQDYLSYTSKLSLLLKYALFRLSPKPVKSEYEVSFLLYSKACERLLTPIILNLLQRLKSNELKLNVHLIVLSGVHQLRLNPQTLDQLASLGCHIETDYFSLVRACAQPKNKLVMMCLDHRYLYDYHKCGVDTADTLKKFSVKTISIQHGGTREDSVRGLASTASDTILVWGKRVFRDLLQKYGVDSNRLRLVGNPLHDRLASLNRGPILKKLIELYPEIQEHLPDKKVILVATCLHTEYQGQGQEDEQGLYREYIRHVYQSVDFSQAILLVKMHPLDKKDPNLYLQAAERYLKSPIIIVEPEVTELDVYSLLLISDLLITRASTVAEEALMMGKKAIAFDLFTSGPSEWYRHLEAYGSYTTTYASPKEALKDSIFTALFYSSSENKISHPEIVQDLTYCLDGNSTSRAVDEILVQLFES